MPSGITGKLGIDRLAMGDLQINPLSFVLASHNVHVKRHLRSHWCPFARPYSPCVR